ncbi:hypothetical protein [Agromyces larvae]|uniref:Uncharacterized protein n=1 Tax=Agromyces larvae TaxID=2929802 RepID=A0ABY4C401_9MICO|nr:hypothetical protein [Agromyces larvae]UOE44698.1 hypothetical protein MTO99_02575 [Agromyces larvae]
MNDFPVHPFPADPTRAEYAAHRRAARADGSAPRLEDVFDEVVDAVTPYGTAAASAGSLVGIALALIGLDPLASLGLGLATAIAVIAGGGFSVFRSVIDRSLDDRLRLGRVAAAHGFAYAPDGSPGWLPGVLHEGYDAGRIIHRVRSMAGRQIDAGVVRHASGVGKERTTTMWTYLAFELDAPLPHIVLDGAKNGGFLASLPTALAGNRRLSLEGDFDRSFRLWLPEGYERDALYIFTPDLMALLVDDASAYDIEIIDDWMILFRWGGADPGLPAFWKKLGRVGRVAERLALRSGRYRDERVQGNLRASQVQLAAASAAEPAASAASAPAAAASVPAAAASVPAAAEPPGTRAAAHPPVAAAPRPRARPRIAEAGRRLRRLPRVHPISLVFVGGVVCAYLYLTVQDLLGG